MAELTLPLILAGPIVRRATPHEVFVWVATSVPCVISGELVLLPGGRLGGRLCAGASQSIPLGRRLHIALVRLAPDTQAGTSPGLLPTRTLLGYNLHVAPLNAQGRPGVPISLGAMGLLDGPGSLCLPGCTLPSLVLATPGEPPDLLYGSCRKLHGEEEDALPLAEAILSAAALDPRARPSALLLGGDQIYADDVAGPIIGHIGLLARALLGRSERLPGVAGPLADLPVNGRQGVTTQLAGFTSTEAGNHLLGFGEFAAMYLLAWNGALWPEALPEVLPGTATGATLSVRKPVPVAPRGGHPPPAPPSKEEKRFAEERERLELARVGLPAVRRLLANIPTWMMFDDHEITDDWYLTQAWKERVLTSQAGRRIVSNGLAAYWAFQGWGNDPASFPPEFVQPVVTWLTTGTAASTAAAEDVLLGWERWDFTAPVGALCVAIDQRTRRGYDGAELPPRLLDPAAAADLRERLRSAGMSPGATLLYLSPTPVMGFDLIETVQEVGSGVSDAYAMDQECWQANLAGYADMMDALAQAQPGLVIFLSGDVHYGFTILGRYQSKAGAFPMVQVTSSALKNSSSATRTLVAGPIEGAQRSVRRLAGWKIEARGPLPSSPRRELRRDRQAPRLARVLEELRARRHEGGVMVVTDPARAAAMGRDPLHPDFEEVRRCSRAQGWQSGSAVGENNLGRLTLDPERRSLTHALTRRLRGEVGEVVVQEDLESGIKSLSKK